MVSLSIQAQTFSESDILELSFSPERLNRVVSFLQSWIEAGKIPYAISMVVMPFAHYSEFVHKYRVLEYQALVADEH
jgi:hypothetical protein